MLNAGGGAGSSAVVLPAPASPEASSGNFPTSIQHVVVIALENRELDQVVGVAPFQTYLYDHYAPVTNFYAYCHGILDYLSVTSGSRSGCGTVSYQVYNVSSIAMLAKRSGDSWIDLDQNMSEDCSIHDSGAYLVRHNPFVWYGPIVDHPKTCEAHDQPLGAWTPAHGALRNYTFVTPNATNDCHSANESVCDGWLRAFLGPVLNDSKRMASTVFFIWYDEGTTNDGYTGRITGGHTYLVAVCALCVGHVASENATDFELLTTTEWLLGWPSLGHGDNAVTYPPMKSLFAE